MGARGCPPRCGLVLGVKMVLTALDGRFRPRYDLDTLRMMVVQAAGAVRPEAPEVLTSTEFDRWRAVSEWPDTPLSASICRRLGLRWREVVSLALSPVRDWPRTVGMRRQVPLIAALSDEEIRQALRLADRLLGGSALRPAAYDEVMGAAKRRDRRRWMYGGQLFWVPNSDQIRHAAGSWGAALELAGLERPGRVVARRGAAVVSVLDAYVEETGQLAPVDFVIGEWRRKRGAVERTAGRLVRYEQELRSRRRQRGQDTPAMNRRGGNHPRLSQATHPPSPGEAHPQRWSWDTAVTVMGGLLCELPPGTQRLSQRVHRRLARGKGLPSPSSISRLVKREERRRRSTGWVGSLTVEDFWAEASRRAAVLRRGSSSTYSPVERPGAVDDHAVAPERTLDMRGKPDRRGRTMPPASRAARGIRRGGGRRGRPRGVSHRDAIAEFVEEQGAFPSRPMLRYWAREVRGLSLATETGGRHQKDCEWVAHDRESRGAWVPTVYLTMADRTLLHVAGNAMAPPAIPKQRRHWPPEEALSVAGAAIRSIGSAPSITEWMTLSKNRPDLPSYATVYKAAKQLLGTSFANFVRSAWDDSSVR
jgi:hypothetical protein